MAEHPELFKLVLYEIFTLLRDIRSDHQKETKRMSAEFDALTAEVAGAKTAIAAAIANIGTQAPATAAQLSALTADLKAAVDALTAALAAQPAA